jgi:hypothetical protein
MGCGKKMQGLERVFYQHRDHLRTEALYTLGEAADGAVVQVLQPASSANVHDKVRAMRA